MGTGELRRIHSRVAWMFLPVERSMTVSARTQSAWVKMFWFNLHKKISANSVNALSETVFVRSMKSHSVQRRQVREST